MDNNRVELSASELVRWALVAAVIIAGLVLFFYLAPSTDPVIAPTVQERAP